MKKMARNMVRMRMRKMMRKMMRRRQRKVMKKMMRRKQRKMKVEKMLILICYFLKGLGGRILSLSTRVG